LENFQQQCKKCSKWSSIVADAGPVLEQMGRRLIEGCLGRLERAFRSMGPDMQCLLSSLDGVHDVLQSSGDEDDDEQQQPSRPEDEHSFVCSVLSPGELELSFSSSRKGVAQLLVGSLAELADRLHSTQALVSILEAGTRDQSGMAHHLLSISIPQLHTTSVSLKIIIPKLFKRKFDKFSFEKEVLLY
jgi:Haem-NO-binding